MKVLAMLRGAVLALGLAAASAGAVAAQMDGPSAAEPVLRRGAAVAGWSQGGLRQAPGADTLTTAPALATAYRESLAARIGSLRSRRVLVGASVGAVIGAAAGYLLASRAEDCDYVCGAGEAGSAVLGGVAGGAIGALIAASTD